MTSPTGNIRGPQKKPAGEAARLAKGAQDEVLKAAGLSVDRLGPSAKAVAKALLEEFTAKGGRPSDAELAAAETRLREAAQQDGAVTLRTRLPRMPAGKAAQIPKPLSDGGFVKKQGDKLILHPSLATPDHGVAKLLKALGIDPQNLPPNVAHVLDDVLRSNTSDQLQEKSWKALVQVLPQHSPKLQEAAAKPTVSKTEAPVAPTPKATIGEAPTRNKGLHANAPESTGTGHKNNAIALLAQNLSRFNKAKLDTPELAKLTTEIADAYAAQLEASTGKKLSAGEYAQVKQALAKVLKPSDQSPDGNVRITDVVSNVYRELAAVEAAQKGGEASPSTALAATLAEAINKAVSSEDPKSMDAFLAREPNKRKLVNGLDDLAAAGISSLISAELGQPVTPPSDAVLGKLSGIVSERGGAAGKKLSAVVDSTVRKGTASARALEKGMRSLESGAAAPISPELRARAEAALKELANLGGPESPLHGIDPKSKEGKRVVAALAQVLGEAKTDVEVIAKAADYFKQQTDIAHPMLEHGKAMAQSGAVTDPEQLAFAKAVALTQTALFAANPEQYLAGMQAQLNQSSAQPPAPFDHTRIDVGQFRGIPALTGQGMPNDANGRKAQLYAQRSMAINAVLNDPSLSIEDKIFLFMMWFAAFADEERKIKMEEIANLDRIDAEKHEVLRRSRESLKNVKDRSGELVAGHEMAKKNLEEAKAGGDPKAIEAAQRAVDTSAKQVAQNESKRAELEDKINRLQTETEEAPKSREILLFELDRITQLRGNIMDMAKKFLEDSHRRIQQIMR